MCKALDIYNESKPNYLLLLYELMNIPQGSILGPILGIFLHFKHVHADVTTVRKIGI